ncbi:MAG: 50S ribosomal protein L21 [Patescibacteria group bacterium]
MEKFAVIESGGKQYIVTDGENIRIEKITPEAGEDFSFDKVLLRVNGEKIELGTPYVEGAKVKSKIVRQGRDEKKIIFRYHSKTRYRKKKGHRQPFTEVQIVSV